MAQSEDMGQSDDMGHGVLYSVSISVVKAYMIQPKIVL